MDAYEKALQQLSRVPLAEFLAERNRLARELRANGDAAGATQIEKRRKPPASVWVVNQLYWQARDAFDAMLAAAATLRRGDVSAGKAYREALAGLHKRAAGILENAGQAASDATLRRASTSLAAIAAAGGFDPEPPGALAVDLDPPGFAAAGVAASPATREPASPAADRVSRAAPPTRSAPSEDRTRAAAAARAAAERDRRRQELERQRAQQAEKKRREQELARLAAARARLRQELRDATTELRTRERELASLDRQRQAAQQAADDARVHAKDLEQSLTELEASAAAD